MTRKILESTTQPVVRSKDVMNKFKCSRGQALKIMQHDSLHSYYIGRSLVCERQYFDDFINQLIDTGGMMSISPTPFALQPIKQHLDTSRDAVCFVNDIIKRTGEVA